MPKSILKNFLFFTVLYILSKTLQVKAVEKLGTFQEVFCKSITITNINEFKQLQNCTIVTGHVRLVEMDVSSADLKLLNASNIEEITEYLLVYHVNGLDSLERLFPKLIVIRGTELLFDEYGLAVVENRNMINVGLVSLLRVLRGSIRIENNPSLCFVNTINWAWIMGNHSKQYYYDVHKNKSPNECPLCYTYQDELKVKEVNRHKRCWSHNKFQKTVPHCNQKSNCLTSCSDKYCKRCTKYVSENGCMDMCLPPKYRLALKLICVTNCTVWNMAQLGLECVTKCPKHYEEVLFNNARVCVLNCRGDFVIHGPKDLEGLNECYKIEGSLTIEIHDTEKPIVEMLDGAFHNLNEVTGYIKILNSPQITSFHFFKNLHTIGGSELIENRYSLYVLNNRYLQDLFLRSVIGTHGCFYFHLNPRMCYSNIFVMQLNFKECKELTVMDVSPSSNGEEAVCGSILRHTNATVLDVNSDSAVIEVSTLTHDQLQVQVGYVYYYKEAPFQNVTKFEGRHGCGIDTWFTDIVLDIKVRHILRNLKPATQYAFFVNSMCYIDYPISMEFVSDIQYFKTLPAKPGMVAKIYYNSLSLTEIELHWWPPRITNGVLGKYILQYEITNLTLSNLAGNKTAADEDCQCPKLHTESRIPTPHVDKYYSKEKLLYIDFVLNFVYTKRVVNTTAKPKTKKTNSTESGVVEATTISAAGIDNTTLMDNGIETTTSETTTAKSASTTAVSVVTANNTANSTEAAREAAFHKAFLEFERKWELEGVQLQNDGKEKFVIPHSKPICGHINAIALTNKVDDNCVPLEVFEGGIEIPSNSHSYILRNLEPEKTYRISLRACVKDLVNGCGAAKVIYAQTVSQRLETILESFTFNKMGMSKK